MASTREVLNGLLEVAETVKRIIADNDRLMEELYQVSSERDTQGRVIADLEKKVDELQREIYALKEALSL